MMILIAMTKIICNCNNHNHKNNDTDNYKDSKTDDFVDIDINRARMLQGYCSSLSCTELTDSPNLEDFSISKKKCHCIFRSRNNH